MVAESVLLLLSGAEGILSPGSQMAGAFRGAGFEIDFLWGNEAISSLASRNTL